MGLVIDLFAGGGGASTGYELATGYSPDIAINHDEWAVAMHRENHPETLHYCQNIVYVRPEDVVQGREVSLLWASPDCTHFSKAKGAKPRSKKIRSLAWTVVKWALRVHPRVIILENVEEFKTWGRLDKDGRPIEKEKGKTFEAWKRALRRAGYSLEHRELVACDYGAPTSRKRFFLVARRDGLPIVWPEATHGSGLQPFRTAAECLDWNEPLCSVFADKKGAAEWAKQHGKRCPRRPLAVKTMERIARGIQRFCIEDSNPYVVKNDSAGEGLVLASFSRQFGQSVGCRVDSPAPTVMSTGAGKTALTLAYMQKMRGTNIGSKLASPLHTISAGGTHHALTVAYLVSFYSSEREPVTLEKPMRTVVTKDSFALVTVKFQGKTYAIIDVAQRMLTPRELYRAQGFPESYIIDQANGAKLSKEKQVQMCGNSVAPPVAAALINANCRHIPVSRRVPYMEAV